MPSVNKCITICTPSIYGCINGSPCPPTYLVSDAGTINGYRVATIPLIRSQVVAFAIHPTDRSSPSCYILRYSYGISFHSELAQEHSILYSIRAYDPVFELAFDSAFDFIAPRVYPFFLRPRYLITTNLFPLQLYNRFPSFYEYRLYIYTTVDTTR
jgi:hypothetical protein